MLLLEIYLDGSDDMRKNALVICCVTCVCAAFGAFFRWLQNMTAFEEETGLYISGSPWSMALVGMTLLVAAALLIILLTTRKHDGRTELPHDYADAMRGTTALYKPAYILLAAMLFSGSVLNFLSAGKDMYPVFQYILSLCGLLGFAGFLILGSAPEKNTEPNLICLGASLLILLYCFWLVVSYREHGSSPVVWGYAMEILALACSLMAFYYLAGVAFGRRKPVTSVFFAQMASYLCIVTLPDERVLGQRIMLAATAGMLLFLSWMVLSNLREPAPPETPEE